MYHANGRTRVVSEENSIVRNFKSERFVPHNYANIMKEISEYKQNCYEHISIIPNDLIPRKLFHRHAVGRRAEAGRWKKWEGPRYYDDDEDDDDDDDDDDVISFTYWVYVHVYGCARC
jgi:hypothetical protein